LLFGENIVKLETLSDIMIILGFVIIIFASFLYLIEIMSNRKINRRKAKDNGYSSYKEFLYAKKIGALSSQELSSIVRGRFPDRNSWFRANKSGFDEYKTWKHAYLIGAKSPTELEEITSGGFKNRYEWKKAKDSGFMEREIWRSACRLDALNPTELKGITEGGFENREEWLAAKNHGVETRRDYLIKLDVINMNNIISKLRPNIPVQLSRIATLSGVSLEKVERILKSICEDRSVGEYLQMEQVFIRASPEDRILEEAFEEWSKNERKK